MRPATRGALALLALALTACSGLEPTVLDRFVQRQQRSLVRLVDQDGQPRGLAVVVRATHEAVVLLGPDQDGPAPLLQLGSERVPARRLGGGLLLCPRRWDLRAVLPAPPLGAGSEVLLLSARLGPWIDGWTAPVLSPPEGPLRLGAALAASPRPDRAAPEPEGHLDGALAFTPTGELVGLVLGPAGEGQLEVRDAGAVVRELLPLAPPGEEVLAPEEAARVFQVSLGRVTGLPAASDEWGPPDYLLLLEVGAARLEPFPLGPGARERGPWLVRVPERGPVLARLVERDVTLAEGVVDHEVTLPAEAPTLLPRLELAFLPHPAFLRENPAAWPAGGELRVQLAAEEVDPDRASGPDRTPLGATPTALRRVVAGSSDLHGGDANDLLLLDAGLEQELCCAFLRRDPRATLGVQVRSGPGLPVVLQAVPGKDRRLAIGRGRVATGRSLLRVQMLAGPPGPTAWELLLVPANDAFGLVRTLFRLLAREAPSEAAWLDTREFAEELAAVLSFEAGLDPETAASAILAELGHRSPVARHLALRLLELHFPPAQAALEAVRAEGTATRRGVDAGLLLALRRGGGPRDVDVLRRAALDPDPLIRLRALVVANGCGDPGLRLALREMFRADPSPLVRRALERSE